MRRLFRDRFPFTLLRFRHWRAARDALEPEQIDRVRPAAGRPHFGLAGAAPSRSKAGIWRNRLRDPFGQDLKTKLKRGLLSFDSFLDSGVFHAARWLREYYERFSAFMDRFHVAGWRRWVLVEPLSEGATLGIGGHAGHAGARDPGLPRNLRRRLAEEIRARRHLPRPLRQRGRLARHPAQRRDSAGRLSRPPDQGGARDRRPALLRAFRHRSVGPGARADRECARRRRGAGRLLDHAAARQEPVPEQRAHDRAQGEGSLPGDLARDAADQERDPQALSRPRLHGRRRVRRGCGGAVLLQQVGARREPRRSRDARRPVQGADALRAARQPAGRPRARQYGARQPDRGRLHDRRPGVRRAAQPGDRDRPARRARRQLLSRLRLRRDEEAGRDLPEVAARARVRRAHRPRRQSAARGRQHGRVRCCASTAPTTR